MAEIATKNTFQETEISNKNEMFNENKMLIDEYENNNENNNEKLPITLFQEIETELLGKLLHTEGSESGDETDAPIEFIQNIVNTVKQDFDGVVEEGERKTFLNILTKVFATLLSVKADNLEKNNQNFKVIRFNGLTIMVRTKLTPKKTVRIRQWLPKESYTKYKIKTLLPEQKAIEIKKNGQVVRTVTVRRKTQKFTDRWTRTF